MSELQLGELLLVEHVRVEIMGRWFGCVSPGRQGITDQIATIRDKIVTNEVPAYMHQYQQLAPPGQLILWCIPMFGAYLFPA
jgi:hypothetical protein